MIQTLQQKLIFLITSLQYSPVVNSSALSNFSYKTQKRISNFKLKANDILHVIKNLNPNKAHGWNNVSIRMIR